MRATLTQREANTQELWKSWRNKRPQSKHLQLFTQNDCQVALHAVFIDKSTDLLFSGQWPYVCHLVEKAITTSSRRAIHCTIAAVSVADRRVCWTSNDASLLAQNSAEKRLPA